VYLSAVLLPPPAQREEIVRLLSDVATRIAPPSADRPRWLRGRSVAADRAGTWLHPLASDLLAVHLTRFGFVEPGTVTRLRAALEEDAAGWTSPTLHAVGRLSAHGSDERLHMALDGEVEHLRRIFRGITDSALRATLMLDRRSFAPLLPVADLDDTVPDDALEALVAALEDFRGLPWRAEVLTLVRVGFGPDDQKLQEVATVPIGHGHA
jgi:hypothetical protein